MKVKRNVRLRRADRMKQIIRAARQEALQTSENVRPSVPAHRFPTSADDPHMTDPEYVWKQMNKGRWETWLKEERSPGGALERRSGGGPKRPAIGYRFVASVFLFVLVWGLFQFDHPLAVRGQLWIRQALTEPYDFAAVAAWYKDRFGSLPSFLPAWGRHGGASDDPAQKTSAAAGRTLYSPVRGKIVVPFGPDTQGVTLETPADAPVSAIDTGIVLSVSESPDTGSTVTIQHPNGLQSIYGSLRESALKPHDWVKGGERIGTVAPADSGRNGKFYFAVKKDNQFVNPAEVVSFD